MEMEIRNGLVEKFQRFLKDDAPHKNIYIDIQKEELEEHDDWRRSSVGKVLSDKPFNSTSVKEFLQNI